MINCQNCGAENLMTSIFCHSCGAKLDLDAAAPEEKMAEEESKKRKKKIIGRSIKGAVALVVLGCVACFFIPVSVQEYSLSTEERENVKTTWNWLTTEFDPNQHGSLEVPMSAGKASWVLNRVLDPASPEKAEDTEEGTEGSGESSGKATESDSGFQLVSSPRGHLELRNNNYLKVVIKVKILNLIPMDRYAVFNVTGGGGQGPPTVETANAKIGIVPFPGPSKKLVGNWIWQVLSQNSKLTELKDNVKKLNINSKRLVIITKSGTES